MCSCSGVDCSRYITSASPLIHFLTAVRLLLNINGKFGWSRRGCHYFCEVLVKLAFHSKCFCLHSGGQYFFYPESVSCRMWRGCFAGRMQSIVNVEVWCGGQKWQSAQRPRSIVPAFLLFPVSPLVSHTHFISFISSNNRSLRSTIQVFNAHILLVTFPAVSKSTVTS